GGAVAWRATQAGVSRRARTAHLERIGPQLSDSHERCQPSHDSDQSPLSQLGHSVQRCDRLRTAASRRVAGQDCRNWSSSAGRTVLSATGSAAAGAGKRDATCCGRAASILPWSYCARSLPSVRFAPLCWWRFCRPHTVSAASDSYGPTEVSPSRLTTAASTAMCGENAT